MNAPQRIPSSLRLSLAAALWLAAVKFAPNYLYRLLPRAWVAELTLPTYSMICQIVTLTAGLLVTRASLPSLREALGAQRVPGRSALVTLLAAPGVFVAASALALTIAEPYLLRELQTSGPGITKKNAGAFGQAVTQAPLLVTLVWGAVLAAVCEELLFRGAIWSAIRALVIGARVSASRVARHRAAMSGALATFGSAAVFGWMHADMNGSVGIVRVVATTCLGFACGLARFATGSVLAAMLLHVTYNTLSVGLGRGWFASAADPLLSAVPNPLLFLAGGALVCCTAILVATRIMRNVPPSAGPESGGS